MPSRISGRMSRDLVVVIPGIMGSSLADKDGKEVWGLRAGTILKALVKLGSSLDKLTLPPDLADGPAPDGVLPTGVIGALHVIPGLWTPVQGYEGLVKFLLQPRFGLTLDCSDTPGNLLLFAYDWRLSNRYTAELLKDRVERALTRWRESHPDAKVIFVCHSMGGLIAHWYLNKLGGADVTRALVTAGTPHRGALKAAEQLVNGARAGLGPIKADLTRFARSLPSSYQLLPEYACIEGPDGVLQKTTELGLPELDPALVSSGMEFHEQLDDSPRPGYPLHPVVGIDQPTWTTARITDERIEPLGTINGREPAGDGTVPRFSARPKAMSERDPSLQGLVEGHGSMAVHKSMLDQLDFVLTAEDVTYKEVATAAAEIGDPGLGVSVPDLHDSGEQVEVAVRYFERRVLEAIAVDEYGKKAKSELVKFDKKGDETGRYTGRAYFEGLDPGGYLITLRAPDDPQGLEVSPVHAATLVWGD